jgi:hypothetical protein
VPAIVLEEDKQGRWVVLDGAHRLDAVRSNKMAEASLLAWIGTPLRPA